MTTDGRHNASANERATTGRPGQGDIVGDRESPEPLELAVHENLVAHSRAAAVLTSTGRVLDDDGWRSVTVLDYNSHLDAEPTLARIALDVDPTGGISPGGAEHRAGSLITEDAAIVAAVSLAHGKDAYAARGWLSVSKYQGSIDVSNEWVVAC